MIEIISIIAIILFGLLFMLWTKRSCKCRHKYKENYVLKFNSGDYTKDRNALIKFNSDLSLENSLEKLHPLPRETANEAKVASAFNYMLQKYLTMYNPQRDKNATSPLVTPVDPFPPHSYFPVVKNLYEQNPIFEFLNSMPKGGLLHIHSGAICDLEWLLTTGIFMKGKGGSTCYINSNILQKAGTPNQYLTTDLELFRFSLVTPTPGSWQSVGSAPLSSSIKNSLTKLLTMDASLRNVDTPVTWKAFEVINERYGSLRSDDIYAVESWRIGLQKLAQNGIHHIDIRLGFGGPLNPSDTSTSAKAKIISKAISKINQFMIAYNTSNITGTGIYPNLTIKIILGTPRIVGFGELDTILEAAYQIKSGKDSSGNAIPNWTSAIGDIITGYDLIAEEDPNYTTYYYIKTWLNTPKYEAQYGVKLPYYFHDGESDWELNQNIIDAVLLGAKRIGHGFNIGMKPGVKNFAKSQDICFEICPISNQMLQYIPDIRTHFANSLFREGVPMVLCSDDPVMFGYTGMTYDFYAASVSWQLNLKAIKRLVFNSIIYSSLSDAEKPSAIEKLTSSWNAWIDRTASSIGMTNLSNNYKSWLSRMKLETKAPISFLAGYDA